MKNKKKTKKGKKGWMRPRHRLVRNILSVTLGVYTRFKYKIKVEKFREQEKRPYLILFNHQTAFDQFFVGMSFRGPVYYVASEDIFTKGWVSRLIKYLVAPIPIKKQSTDVRAVMTCLRVAREGGTIAIAPEGNRTFGGSTGYMNFAIAQLARKMGLPIALYRIEGGYGVHPRWSDAVRGGGMRSYVSRVIMPEEYSALTDEELFFEIKQGLNVVEGRGEREFPHKRRAEYLERAFYTCSSCGLSELRSEGATVRCKRCGRRILVNSDMTLSGDGFDLPYKNIGEWYDWQCELVNSTDTTVLTDTPLTSDVCTLFRVIPYKNKIKLGEELPVSLYGDRITVGDKTFDFDFASVVTVLGRNKLNIYYGDEVYQIKSGKRFPALEYMNLYYRYKNLKTGGEENDGFLGL